SLGECAFFERAPRRFCRQIGGGAAMDQCGSFGRERLLRFVDLLALKRSEPPDLVGRQYRKQLEEARHVAVLGIAPILPVIIWAQKILVEPNRASGGFTHFSP